MLCILSISVIVHKSKPKIKCPY